MAQWKIIAQVKQYREEGDPIDKLIESRNEIETLKDYLEELEIKTKLTEPPKNNFLPLLSLAVYKKDFLFAKKKSNEFINSKGMNYVFII